MKPAFAIIPFIIVLAGCDAADLRDVRSASLKLQPGITEADAINVIGFGPDSANLGTCGTNTKERAWTCRTITFYGLGNHERLMINEALVDGVWRVNNWNVY